MVNLMDGTLAHVQNAKALNTHKQATALTSLRMELQAGDVAEV